MSVLEQQHAPAAIGRWRLGSIHEVPLRDGTVQRLVQLHERGTPSPHLRALALPGHTRLQVFDVRRLARTLAAELPAAPARDVPGLVHYTLRGIYPTASALHQAVAEVCELAAVPVALEADEVCHG